VGTIRWFGDRKSGVVAAVAELASSPLIKVQAPATTSTCTPIENGILPNLLSWKDLNEDARSPDLLGYRSRFVYFGVHGKPLKRGFSGSRPGTQPI
jgi:hypothetical protein